MLKNFNMKNIKMNPPPLFNLFKKGSMIFIYF